MYRSGRILVLPHLTLHGLKSNDRSHHLRHDNLVLLRQIAFLVLSHQLLHLVLINHIPISLLSVISIRIMIYLRRCPPQALLVQIAVREGMVKVMETIFLLPRHI
jgi:hypothetical protein